MCVYDYYACIYKHNQKGDEESAINGYKLGYKWLYIAIYIYIYTYIVIVFVILCCIHITKKVIGREWDRIWYHGQLTLPFNWYSEIEVSWTEGNIDEPVMACNPSLLFVDK